MKLKNYFRMSVRILSRTLLLTSLCVGFMQPLPAAAQKLQLNDGLVAWYPFNGDANDASVNGLDAQVYGAFPGPDRFNHRAASYFFDGVKSFMEIYDPSNLLNFEARSDSYTVAIWVNINSLDERHEFIIDRIGTNSTPYSYDIYYDPTVGKFIANCSDGAVNVSLPSVTTPTTKTWYHLAMVCSGGMIQFYINGKQEIGPPLDAFTPNQIPGNFGSTLSNAQGHTIGKHVGDYSGSFHYGFLDNIRIYDRALSVEDLKRLQKRH